MKKMISMLSVFLVSSYSFAGVYQYSNDASQSHHQHHQKYSNDASQGHHDHGKHHQDQRQDQDQNHDQDQVDPRDMACDAIAYEFGPGEWTCNRNWFTCTEQDVVGKVVCNFSLEIVGNVIKGPFNVLEEGAQMGEKWSTEAGDYVPVIGHLVGGALGFGVGAVKGGFESAVGIVAGAVEISGNRMVVESDYFEF